MAAEFYGKEYVLFEGGTLNNTEGEGAAQQRAADAAKIFDALAAMLADASCGLAWPGMARLLATCHGACSSSGTSHGMSLQLPMSACPHTPACPRMPACLCVEVQGRLPTWPT